MALWHTGFTSRGWDEIALAVRSDGRYDPSPHQMPVDIIEGEPQFVQNIYVQEHGTDDNRPGMGLLGMRADATQFTGDRQSKLKPDTRRWNTAQQLFPGARVFTVNIGHGDGENNQGTPYHLEGNLQDTRLYTQVKEKGSTDNIHSRNTTILCGEIYQWESIGGIYTREGEGHVGYTYGNN